MFLGLCKCIKIEAKSPISLLHNRQFPTPADRLSSSHFFSLPLKQQFPQITDPSGYTHTIFWLLHYSKSHGSPWSPDFLARLLPIKFILSNKRQFPSLALEWRQSVWKCRRVCLLSGSQLQYTSYLCCSQFLRICSFCLISETYSDDSLSSPNFFCL